MNSHVLLFLIAQGGVLFQLAGSFLLLKLAFAARKFGGPESGLTALGNANAVSLDAMDFLRLELTRNVKAQFSSQWPGFGFLFLGMACQFVGNFSAL